MSEQPRQTGAYESSSSSSVPLGAERVVEEARRLHMVFNVALRRMGYHMPACNGPACEVCRALLASQDGDTQRHENRAMEDDHCKGCITAMWCSARGFCLAEHSPTEGQEAAPSAQWQPIETAPKDGSSILVWNGYRRALTWYATYIDGSSGWHRQNMLGEPLGLRDIDPETHWAPLPSPPAQEGSPR